MIIKNGKVFQEDGSYKVTDLYIENGRIVSSAEEVTDKTELDASGLKVLPGLVDIHSHGAIRHDFSDADVEGLKAILQYEKSQGITSYCPTSMTLPKEELLKIFQTAKDVEQDETCARIVGINMEGPFLDPVKKGAHVEGYIRKPDVEFFRECNESAGGMIKLVTLAPNMEGAKEFIQELHNEVVISIGHTAADYECAAEAMEILCPLNPSRCAAEAMELGALHVTHLYNAMNPMGHREPGVIGAAADNEKCMVELIGDGIHIHPVTVRNTFRLFGDSRVILISDSMMATGMENGIYELGGQEVTMKDRKATLADGTIAGSATCLFGCMKSVISMGVPEREAILAATANPARSIGIYDEVGSLAPGKRADIVLTDDELNVVKVL